VKRLLLTTLLVFALLLTSGFAQNINIGFTVSKTGALNVDSLEQYRGFELWRDQVNAAGGIKAGGKNNKVQFVGNYDDESNVKRVQQLYTRMILQDNADFLFSPYSSSLTATAAIVTEQNGKIMMTSGSAEGKTYTLGNRYLFQMFAPGTEYLKFVLDMLKAKDPKANCATCHVPKMPKKDAAELNDFGKTVKAAKGKDGKVDWSKVKVPEAKS